MGGVQETKFFREMWSDDISRGQMDGNHTYKWQHFQRLFGKDVKEWIWEDRSATPPEDKEAVHSFIMKHQCQSHLLTHWRRVADHHLCFILFFFLGHFWVSAILWNDNGVLSLFSRFSSISVLGWWLFGGAGMRLNNQTSSSRIYWFVYTPKPPQYLLYISVMLF